MAEEIVTRCALAIHGKLSVDYQVPSSTLNILAYFNVDCDISCLFYLVKLRSICLTSFKVFLKQSTFQRV